MPTPSRNSSSGNFSYGGYTFNRSGAIVGGTGAGSTLSQGAQQVLALAAANPKLTAGQLTDVARATGSAGYGGANSSGQGAGYVPEAGAAATIAAAKLPTTGSYIAGKGFVTSTGQVYPTSNPNFVPPGYTSTTGTSNTYVQGNRVIGADKTQYVGNIVVPGSGGLTANQIVKQTQQTYGTSRPDVGLIYSPAGKQITDANQQTPGEVPIYDSQGNIVGVESNILKRTVSYTEYQRIAERMPVEVQANVWTNKIATGTETSDRVLLKKAYTTPEGTLLRTPEEINAYLKQENIVLPINELDANTKFLNLAKPGTYYDVKQSQDRMMADLADYNANKFSYKLRDFGNSAKNVFYNIVEDLGTTTKLPLAIVSGTYNTITGSGLNAIGKPNDYNINSLQIATKQPMFFNQNILTQSVLPSWSEANKFVSTYTGLKYIPAEAIGKSFATASQIPLAIVSGVYNTVTKTPEYIPKTDYSINTVQATSNIKRVSPFMNLGILEKDLAPSQIAGGQISGIIKDIQTKPLDYVLLYGLSAGAGFALGGIVKGAAYILKVSRVASQLFQGGLIGAGLSFGAVEAINISSKISSEPDWFKKGEILGQNELKIGVGIAGYKKGSDWAKIFDKKVAGTKISEEEYAKLVNDKTLKYEVKEISNKPITMTSKSTSKPLTSKAKVTNFEGKNQFIQKVEKTGTTKLGQVTETKFVKQPEVYREIIGTNKAGEKTFFETQQVDRTGRVIGEISKTIDGKKYIIKYEMGTKSPFRQEYIFRDGEFLGKTLRSQKIGDLSYSKIGYDVKRIQKTVTSSDLVTTRAGGSTLARYYKLVGGKDFKVIEGGMNELITTTKISKIYPAKKNLIFKYIENGKVLEIDAKQSLKAKIVGKATPSDLINIETMSTKEAQAALKLRLSSPTYETFIKREGGSIGAYTLEKEIPVKKTFYQGFKESLVNTKIKSKVYYDTFKENLASMMRNKRAQSNLLFRGENKIGSFYRIRAEQELALSSELNLPKGSRVGTLEGVKAYNPSVSLFKSASMTIPGVFAIGGVISELDLLKINQLNKVNLLGINKVNLTNIKPLSEFKQREIQLSNIRQENRLNEAQVSKQAQITETTLTTLPKLITITPPTTRAPSPTLPKIPIYEIPRIPEFNFAEKKRKAISKKVALYKVLLKKRGKFRQIGAGFTKEEALLFGAKRTKLDIARTFKIQKSGEQELFGIQDIGGFKPLPSEFREFKIRRGKQIATPMQFTQLNVANLQSFEEKASLKQSRAQAKQMRQLIGF